MRHISNVESANLRRHGCRRSQRFWGIAIAQAQDDMACNSPPPDYLADVQLLLAAEVKGAEQQRAEANVVEILDSCPGDAPVFSVLLQGGRARPIAPKLIFTLASVLNATKTPWMGSPDKQEEWKEKILRLHTRPLPSSARKSVLNGALMNADGLYRQATSMMATAKPGSDDFKDAREGLEEYPAVSGITELRRCQIPAVRA